MKKAYEITKNLLYNTKPVLRDVEDQTWDDMNKVEQYEDLKTSLLWSSNVPGSGAPECIAAAMVQALKNRGWEVPMDVALLIEGLEHVKNTNYVELHKTTSKLFSAINNAQKNSSHSYWNYTVYENFEQYEKSVIFPKFEPKNINTETLYDKIKGGWVAQMVGAAVGTQVEGFVSDNLYETFGEIQGFLREPTTYNDDVTFELAFLHALLQHGSALTSCHIALEWISLIPAGWSAEEVALRNIRYGIMPPASGTHQNPFNEWIGAQMRGAVCGQVAPRNPHLAAKLAWMDGEVSHANNGILGEVFNAVLVSFAFTSNNVREILIKSIELIPKDSEYRSVLDFAYAQCLAHKKWKDAWKMCEKKYETYNWIHAYPNVAAEVIALFYGDGNFDKTLHIITMAGMDVDCNAAQIMTVLGTIIGYDNISKKWLHPAFNNLQTYMRKFREISLEEIVDMTLQGISILENRNA